MRSVHRLVLVAALALVATAATLSLSGTSASAVDPEPTIEDTARLLGYMWGDGSEIDGVWDVNGPSGAANLVEELVELHGGTWVDRKELTFRLPAPYDWSDWKSSLPNDGAWERAAVENPHFLAALLETEGAVTGHIYDQSACCVDGFTFERLTDLRDLLVRSGYATATIVRFNNVESGKVMLDEADFRALRAATTYVCPNSDAAIRIPGGTDYEAYGDLQWISVGDLWDDVVRTDCAPGQAVPKPTPLTGTCTATVTGNAVTLDWTFTLGDVVIRRNSKYVTGVSGRNGPWSETPPQGIHTYELRVFAFGQRTDVGCGTVEVPGGDTPPPPLDSGCSAVTVGDHVQLSWDDFGSRKYFLRLDGKWRGTVTNATTTTIPGSAQEPWMIRYFVDGLPVDVPCSSADEPTPPCQVSNLDEGMRITWTAVDGVGKYQVRVDGTWRAAVTNSTSYDDPTGSTANSYIIRYWDDGLRNEISCT